MRPVGFSMHRLKRFIRRAELFALKTDAKFTTTSMRHSIFRADAQRQFSSIQSNAFEANYEMFMGTKGTLIMARELDAFLFHEGENSSTRVEVSRQSGPVADSSATQAADSTTRTVDTPVGGNAGQRNLLPERDRRVLCGCSNRQSCPMWR